MYNPGVNEHRYLPDADKLSVLAAIILLAYGLARFVNFPSNQIAIQLPGIYLSYLFDARTLVAFLVAGLTATGADWLLRQHPALHEKYTIEHWLLPALTAWVIGFPLFQLPLGPGWWFGFVLGGGLLMLVLVAEYITIDPDDVRYPAATAGLTAVAFALYLVLAISVRSAGSRLLWIVPALTLAGGLVSLRTLHLRLHGKWAFVECGIITLILGQIAAALYYLPLLPVPFGLIMLGCAFGLTSLLASLADGVSFRQAMVEPALILVIVLIATIWLS